MDYDWQGNVRELENVIERAVVLATGSALIARPASRKPHRPRHPLRPHGHRPDASLFEIIEESERRVIADMLEKCGWNQTEAADRFRIPALHSQPEDQASGTVCCKLLSAAALHG
jgi:DNA-binding NtrC family response regulator